ncbi:SDR family NAD(P)-dependent oxidoreductase [Sphingomonas sp. PL-96]|uniref:SDR family NAD(P)-dependent oxidoreductase n=1 Tax=Sphingomonas sp. PL-96 TaxID=2887201 RepID=UPI001E5A4EF7|nr:SDR family NAD(P)-dependent oxidoreductase [Sphingomonas sp. PL-96]MCC2978255.1 SDR family NAD(P)-dependent oxidoreductase [Sphingomonas sp. PL-96]
MTYKHAIITGGASGIGRALVSRLLHRGTHVAVLDRTIPSDVMHEFTSVASSTGAALTPLNVDITDAAGVAEAIEAAVAVHGSPDLVVNCAGISMIRSALDTSPDDFRRMVDVNLNGSFNIASAALPHMKRGSRLALVASMAGITSNYGYAAYGSSKFGVVGLAVTLRYEWEPLGIGVSCICPPEVRTPMVADEINRVDPPLTERVSRSLKLFAGSLDIDTAVNEILRALDAGRFMIVPGGKAKVAAGIYRYLPALHFASVRAIVARHLRRAVEAGSPRACDSKKAH